MKRVINTVLLVMVLALPLMLLLVGCATCQHRDADDNNICEGCGEEYTDADDTGSGVNGGVLSYAPTAQNPSTYTITGIGGATSANIVIPESIGGVAVTGIGEGAFRDCTSLVSITVPQSVTSIGKGAFSGCTGLKSITIPFVGAASYGTSNSYFGHIFGASSYQENASSVPRGLKTVTITGGIRIDNRAFQGCAGILDITIPDTVTSIGSSAFMGCIGITHITIPSSVTSISASAFLDCYKLVDVVNKSSLRITAGSISNGHVAYYAKEVHTGESKIARLSDLLFYTKDGVNYLVGYTGEDAVLVLPDTYGGESYKIYKYAFTDNTTLTGVTISSGVTDIGEHAFSGCANLADLTMGSAVREIGQYAFSGCSALTDIAVPSTVTSIGKSAFFGCDSLGAVYISDLSRWLSIAFIDNTANPLFFAGRLYLGDSLLSDLNIPSDITIIPEYALAGWTSLKSVNIHNGVTEIGTQAFIGCVGLTDLFIPDSVAIIGKGAFFGCTSIESISIPFVGTTIDDAGKAYFGYLFDTSYSSFNNDNVPASIRTVVVRGSTAIATSAFYDCSGITSITLPSSITIIGSYAFSGCTGLVSLNIPSAVSEMGGYIFSGCDSLTTIYYGLDEESWLAFGTTHGAPLDVVYYYSETEPDSTGRYWHYVDGVPTKW